MKSHKVTGGGGTVLHVVETGNPSGRPVLFIHGFSQSWRAWSRQLNSSLGNDHRLVAMDIRGHGLSEKPVDAYADPQLWADDIDAVIRYLALDHPVLSGWSYGPLIILDYIRHYGEDMIGGANFVGGVSKLGSDEALAVLAPEFLGLVPGFFSTDAQESVNSLRSLIDLCFLRPLTDDERYLMLGCCVSVPPYVRQGLLSRTIDNDDLLGKITKPVLLTHGAEDAVVKIEAAEQHASKLTNGELHLMENAGHAAFWDDAPAYNQRLSDFCNSLH